MSHPSERLAERLAALSPRQRAILEERLRSEGIDLGEVGIPPAGERPFYPLSFPQQRIWFQEQLAPGRAIFATPTALRLGGPLSPDALRRAVGEIARRHGVLRTTYPVQDGVPVQQVAPEGTALLLVDLSALPAGLREAEASRAVGDEAWRPIDLARDSVFRPVVVRLALADHVLLLALHHIAVDYWSISILLREVAQLYAAFLEGRPSPLPPLPLQYTDYAVWQRGWLQGEVLERELDFWCERLGNPPPPLELPSDRPRPRVRRHRGGLELVELPFEVIADLKELARRCGATLYMGLLAGFKALILRYTGRADLVVGAPTANRTRAELEPLVGCFINNLALRTDLAGDPSFAEALERVRQTVLAAQAHQDVPFDRVVERLRPDRSLGVSPLFQVSFVLQNTPQSPAQLPAVDVRAFEVWSRKAELDLAVSVWEAPTGLRGVVELDAELFEPETVRRLFSHLGNLLAGVVRAPATRLSDLPLLGEAERREVLEDWSLGPRPQAPASLFLERFRGWVDETPDAVALDVGDVGDAGDGALAYAELDRRTDRLARYLRSFGVGPELPVALFLERSADAVVAMLAVLKAGGAYLPIDPAYPLERVDTLLSDSGVLVLVTRRELAESVPGRAMLVCLEDVDEAPEAFFPPGPLPAVLPEALAYVIYTSGSTGRPKGVLVPHGGLANLARAQGDRFALRPGSRVLPFASLSFDASVSEILVTLAAGGTLVLARREEMLPGPDLARLLRERRVDTVTLPPSALAALPREPLPGLRTLVVAGEACPPDLAAEWAPGRRFLNAYGPTESTVCATVADLTGAGRRPPIGRPIAGVRTVVLDARLHAVPSLVAGELCLGGASLARGYLGRPDLTAERFIPDPIGNQPGERLYRTGDLARWLKSGELDFLGRVDRQVKVRGVRIEPAEVEEALRSYPGVAAAVVLALPEASGSGLRLAAYFVPAEGAPPSPAELRRHLLERLPELMAPSVFVPLAGLPLTPSGKVDRAALPAPEVAPRTAEEGYVAPRTPLERTVAAVWQEVLGVERVGARDNFFDLGGHSLLATQVASRLRDAVGADLAVWMLFENPTPAALALAIEAARPAGPQPPPLTHVPAEKRATGLPLSFAQQRLWFLDRLHPGSSAYNQPVALRLSGMLDVAALERSLGEIVRRHEALRTVFGSEGAEPVQRVLPAGSWSLPRVDLAGLPAEAREAEARRLAMAEGERPFDLQRGPMLRAMLIRLGEEDHAALLTTHHIVSDGWSVGVLVREVGDLYAAFRAGHPSPLPELPVQYGDFAVWQRRWLEGEALEALLAYWRDELAGAPAGLDLPTDRPRQAVRGSRGDRRRTVIPAAVLEPLQALGREAGATLFMTLLAALQAFLHRLTGAADVLVGTPVANRERRELEGLIGFFVNTLVLRGQVAGEITFRDLLAQARAQALAAYDHQDLPFERLVEELQLDRSLNQNPLFEVLFALQNAPAGPLRLAGLEWRPMEAGAIAAKFDLSLTAAEIGEGLAVTAEYPTELFDGDTIERLLGHLGVLLAGAAADPEARISELPLLNEAERRQLFAEDAAELPLTRLHELFEARVAADPGAVAVTGEEESLTYGELDRRADRVARRLRAAGVGPETLVGLCAERSPSLVVGLLGILKAGGAYLPLDPAYPRERLALLLEDSGTPVVLAQEHLAASLPPHGARVLFLEETEAPETDLARTAGDLAYVIYTSGSTGRPKGVAVEHRNAVRLLRSTERWFGFGPDDVWTLFHSFAFDFSVWEIWGALAYGGRLVIVPWEVSRSPEAFAALLAREGVTVLNQTPSAFRQLAALAAEDRLPELPALRTVIFGGEALDLAGLAPWIERHGADRPRLVNMYGITETTVHVTWREIAAADLQSAWRSPIGEPIPDLRLVLLGLYAQPVPVGVAGEIHVAGRGVARGYLGRPDLTAERFVPDPFGPAGSRLYRSGDLARRRADGDVDYLGRADHQVKVRGFRIEPGEIEAALAAQPGVREAVVAVREDRPGDRRLVAYAVPRDGADLRPAELLIALAGRLPDYMVPAAVVVLDSLPLTAHGKVDRRALPAPAASPGLAEAYEPPSDPLEEALAGIFAEVLGLGRIGVRDDFFRAGGHSLLATRVTSRVREAFGVDLPLRELFESPTVAGLAPALRRQLTGGTEEAPPRITRSPLRASGGPFPLSFSQERLWFLDQLEPGTPAYNIPSAVGLRGEMDVPALAQALSAVAARHESLRTRFPAVDGKAVQQVQPPAPVPLPLADLSALPEPRRAAEARRLHGGLARRSFDLARGPLLAGLLVRLEPEEHLLVLVVHHIVSDGWSMTLLRRELARFYAAFAGGPAAALPELPVQYADFADWQRRWLSGEVLDRQLAYWRQRLAGLPVLQLPTDRPRPAVQTFRGGQVSFVLPAEVTRPLAALAHAEGASLFMVLLAGFSALLHRYSGQDDFAVGTFIANRNRAEIEGLIGFFVNNLTLRADLQEDPGLRALLRRTRETTLGAYAHQDLPFEKLIEELRPERDMSRPSLFQAMCVLQNLPGSEERLPGLTLSTAGPQGGAGEGSRANFDLTLWMSGSAEGIAAAFDYNADLFRPETARRMAGHLERLLAAAAADPERPVSALPLLSDAEREQLRAWSVAPAPWDAEVCAHTLFERQAARTPDAVALVAPIPGEERLTRLTYAELNRRANRLARRLRPLGVGPEVRVGICLERSAELIVSVLATLKAGGCYVPMDAAYSADRLAFLLEDSGAGVVITSRSAAAALPEAPAGVRIVDVHREEVLAATAESGDDLPLVESGASPEHLAYVVYTSGSTGKPKGAMIEHRSLANAYLAWEESYRLRGEATAHLQMASFSFDVFSGDLMRALGSGGRLVLCPRELLLDPERLYDFMVAEGVDAAEFVPAVVRGLAETVAASGRSLGFMRLMMVGSDVWYGGEFRALGRLCGDQTRLINSYGASEAAIDTTFFERGTGADETLAADALVPIGRPFGGSAVLLLDRNLEPVPAGVPGELVIGGINLARGYHDRPDLTATRFVPHPSSVVLGDRIYRTGDLARWLPDGNVEFLGRVDHQVKVRGHRIEPGEVEAAIGEHPGVRQAVVLAVAEAPGRPDKRLIAWVVPREEGASLATGDLRAFLAAKLPDYMVPSAFVPAAELPLTPNGKVDRGALAQKAASLPPGSWAEAGDEDFTAPRTPLEELLAGIWSEVLRVERVGVDQSFFDLGGHSLLATQLISRVRRASGVDLPLRALFEAPVLAAFAKRVEDALRGPAGARIPPIVPVPRTDAGTAPLSFSQQRLWFLDRMEPGSPFYNLPAAVLLRGPLAPAVLAASLDEVVRRHEALRTGFAEGADGPRQRVVPELRVPLPVADLAGLTAEHRAAELRRLAREDARTPFDLSRPPLLRALLLRLEPEEHAFLLNQHHIVSDGWSTQVLIGELSVLYGAFASGRPSPLPELPVQYADYAVWQRERMDAGDLDPQLDYWLDRLGPRGEGPPALELPADRPRPPLQTYRGAVLPLELDADLSRGLAALSARSGATLFMTLLAAFQALLARWSGQDDVAVGTPIANRHRAEVEGLIGFFVNTLVLRTRLSGDPTFAGLLDRVREAALGAYAHQDLPFEKLVEALNPVRDPSRTPLFQVMFAFQNAPPSLAARTAPGAALTVAPLEAEGGTAKFDLDLELYETRGGLRGAFEYNTDLFDRATVERMAEAFRLLLAEAVASPDLPVGGLPLMPAAEQAQILTAWSGAGERREETEPVHLLFERQAALRPEADALLWDGGRLSYADLDRQANRLARRLRREGVGAEAVVAVCMDRTPELIVALLGVLKAGGAYLPMDPGYPDERLAWLLEDSGALLALADAGTAGRLPGPVLRLDPGCPALSGEDAAPLAATVDPGHAAYVIYTSGSTGRPKGVVVEHRSLSGYIQAMVGLYGMTPADRVLQFSSVSFDASAEEIYTALCFGATLVLRGDEMLGSPARFFAACEEQGVTVLDIPTAFWHELAGGVEQGASLPACLRSTSTGGEQALAGKLEAWLAQPQGRPFYNVYGPTEATIGFTVWQPPAGWTAASGPVRIGRPLPGGEVYVLDRWLQPAPAGVPGELCLGGPGLARGYLDGPALTAERFVPHPFAGGPGARLYRTGDLARFHADGELEVVGRIDQQAKVRGFRVEPGEVEAALAALPGVRDAAVVVRDALPGGRALVAYVVPAAPEAPAITDLRAALGKDLPDYMVPSRFVLLDALPVTPAGKVDRRALPRPEEAAPEDDPAFAKPSNPVEEVVAAVWAEVLRRERVGLHDDFFALGGHSLLATQAVSRLRDALGVELPVRRLFESPTPAALALVVEEELRGEQGFQPPPLVPMAREGAIPLSFAQQRLWFLDRLQPGSPAYNLPLALRLTGPLDSLALEVSLREVVRRHEALRTTFALADGQPVQRIAPMASLDWALPRIDLSALPAEIRETEARRLAGEEAARPFDLERGPLLRAALLRLEEAEHVALLTQHHIASDGWSTGVLVREVGALYAAFHQGRPSPLPELPVQYADFALWQREWLQGEALAAQLGYWKEALAGAPAVLDLPSDRPRPAFPSGRGGVVAVSVGPELARTLRDLARRKGATLFMVLLAGFQALLHRLTGEDDVVVGTPVANRNRSEVEGLIGFFVNTLVLRSQAGGDTSWSGLLAGTRAAALGAYAHQDLPFERLVDELQPERSLAHNPLFQVLFALQNAPLGRLELAGLDWQPLAAGGRPPARFDLALALMETGDGIAGSIEYAADLFDAPTVARFVEHLKALWQAAAAAPEAPLAELPILSDAQQHQILLEWGSRATESDFAVLGRADGALSRASARGRVGEGAFAGGLSTPSPTLPRVAGEGAPAPATVLDLLAFHAERSPDSRAVLFGDEILTHGELDRRSNNLARRLTEAGATAGAPVGLCAERSLGLVVALVAIWKAGAAFLPLDPGYPPARVAFLVQDSGAPVVIAGPGSGEALSEIPNEIRTLELEAGEQDGKLAAPGPRPEDPAYVLYTSGTTGQPKGVVVEHVSLLATIQACHHDFGWHAGDSQACVAPFSFDIFLHDLFAPITAGGSAELVPLRPALDLERLADAVERSTRCHVVPSLWRQLLPVLRQRPAAAREAVRTVFSGGEAVSADLLAELREAFPAAELAVLYGPTEATIVCSRHLVPETPRGSMLGRPFPGVELRVCDPAGRPVPIGAAGELWIGGPGVARGYLGRPELTAERFVTVDGRRFFRTGDRARFRPDGELEFLGRADDQIKVRGIRMEPAEIEAALTAHPAIRQAVVVAREDGGDDKRLVAYVVTADDGLVVDELRRHLASRLPEAMIPSAFVALPELPLTAHGKVDRRALPEPGRDRPGLASDFVAPRSTLEEVLAGMWAEILEVDQVGVHDDFFALGGHSLLATQLLSWITDSFRVEVPLRKVFERPTVAGLAEALLEDPAARAHVEKTAEVLLRMAELSEDEVESMLEETHG